MTQAELCDGKITRNLISEIECDKASPSISTLRFIAMRLEVPVAYLLSDDENVFCYAKNERIDDVKKLFETKCYKKCIDLIESLKAYDDELNYICAYCHFELGRAAVLNGSLHSGNMHLAKSAEHSAKTVYDTSRIENLMLIYTALAQNVQSPLLEFDSDTFMQSIRDRCDYELYKYLIQDYEYPFKSPIFSLHVKAKKLMKARDYKAAINVLSEIESESKTSYNAHVIFSVYCDLESCYKQLMDFENAYRYASKRLSLIEGFKS